MGHDHHHHDHSHGHHHAQPSSSMGSAFAIGIALNLTFVVVEVGYGIASRSLSLVADAGHNLGDVLGLALSWGAAILATTKPSARRTYGLRSTTILAAAANALILLFITGGLAWEAIRRLMNPTPLDGKTVIVVALIGVVVNGLSALLFLRGQSHDLNVRSAFLHLASDAGLALGVAIAGAIVLKTGWLWLDSAATLAIAIVILLGTWSVMKDSFNLMLGAVPQAIDLDEVRAYLAGRDGVVEVHDLHVWAMSTTETALTAHIVIPSTKCPPSFLSDACRELHHKFGIQHATLQLEPVAAASPCVLASDEVVLTVGIVRGQKRHQQEAEKSGRFTPRATRYFWIGITR